MRAAGGPEAFHCGSGARLTLMRRCGCYRPDPLDSAFVGDPPPSAARCGPDAPGHSARRRSFKWRAILDLARAFEGGAAPLVEPARCWPGRRCTFEGGVLDCADDDVLPGGDDADMGTTTTCGAPRRHGASEVCDWAYRAHSMWRACKLADCMFARTLQWLRGRVLPTHQAPASLWLDPRNAPAGRPCRGLMRAYCGDWACRGCLLICGMGVWVVVELFQCIPRCSRRLGPDDCAAISSTCRRENRKNNKDSKPPSQGWTTTTGPPCTSV